MKEPSPDANELAGLFGVSDRQIRALVKEGLPLEKIVDGKTGKYLGNFVECVKWYVGRKVKGKLSESKSRLTDLQSERIEIELMETRGELVKVSTISNAMEKIIGMLRTQLLSLPQSIAFDITNENDPGVIKNLFENKIISALNSAAKEMDKTKPKRIKKKK